MGESPLFGENIPISPFFMITPFWNRWDPPLSKKNSKKISVFSDKKISDSARPLPPPFGVFLKKKQFFFYASPKGSGHFKMEKQIKDMMVKSVLCSQVIEMEGPKVSHIETQFRGCCSFSSQGYISARWITSKTPAGNID